jgi:hypothetical protein
MRSPFWSIADSDDVDRRRIQGSLDHEIGHIGRRDFETKDGQAPLSQAILPRVGFVRQVWWTHHRPVETALLEDPLYRRCISHNGGEKLSTEVLSLFHLDLCVERSDLSVETFSTEIDVTNLGLY